MFVANADTSVVAIDPSTMTTASTWKAPGGQLGLTVGAGPGTALAYFRSGGTVYTLASAGGRLAESRRSQIPNGIVAIAGFPDGTFLQLSSGAEPQVLQRNADGTVRHGWNLLPPTDSPTGFTGSGGGPVGATYVAGPKGSGRRAASVVDVFSLSQGDPNAPPTTDNADRKGEWTTSGTVQGVKSTGDGVWTVSAEGVLEKWDFFGSGPLASYDGSIVPGGWGRLAGIAADPSGALYVVDALNYRVIKLSGGGSVPPTGGGPGTPTLQNCGQTTISPGARQSLTAGLRLKSKRLRQGSVDMILACSTSADYCRGSVTLTTSALGLTRSSKPYRFRIHSGRQGRLKLHLPHNQLVLVENAAASSRRAYTRGVVVFTTPDGATKITKRFTVRAA